MPTSPRIETALDDVDARTSALWRELVDTSVECELCNEPYNDDNADDAGHIPRLLTCGHTYCQSCLDDWATANTRLADALGEEMAVECPTCRRVTRLNRAIGAQALPKNFELVRARQEMEARSQIHLVQLKQEWAIQVKEKELLAKEAQEHARTAQRESVQASQRALFLAKQVQINEQEKKEAQDLAEEARRRALLASQQAAVLQAETENLKRQLEVDAAQLARMQHDASSAAAVAKELTSKAEQLQQQVDCVRAQLSLHAGRHDPGKLVVLVCEPTTVGSWMMPYTRYAVICIASDTTKGDQSIDPYQAAKTWTRLHQVEEPSSSVKVYRRYSDFVWLHGELQRQYPFKLVPCVPGKQLFFNKDKEFVGERMRLLQAFLRGVLRQPLFAVTEEVRAFLLSTTEELESLRRATSTYYGGLEDDDLLSLDECSPCDDVESRSSSSPRASYAPASSTNTTLSMHSSTWSAWSAVSAITSSAAKLVTTTGTALTGMGSKTGPASLPTDCELELSRSFTEAEGDNAATRSCIERRRKYIDVTRSYQSTAQKGSQLSRASRQQSHHLHRMCELLHDMNQLDQGHAQRRRERLAASKDVRSHQVDEDDDMETRAFGDRASDVFSAISLNTKNDADCMEYALLEIMRMQTLELGGIEDAFGRVRRREEALQMQQQLTPPSSSPRTVNHSSDYGVSLSAVSLKRDELATHRRELNEKVAGLDPGRSLFVLDVLCKNTSEMYKLAKTKRKLFQASQQQLIGVRR
uniref:PX domain-containing protein n=1 Tax=Peronospora matthiolae TaxID=2874970 RepID=A0AAV1TTZ2_9STRA